MPAEPMQSAGDGRSQLRPAAEAPPFSVTRRVVPGAVHVVLAGELDLATVPIAEIELRRAVVDASHVLLDLRALAFIDVAGLNLVMAAHTHARQAGRQLVVVCQGAQCVERLFELTGADLALPLADDIAAASARYDGKGAHPR